MRVVQGGEGGGEGGVSGMVQEWKIKDRIMDHVRYENFVCPIHENKQVHVRFSFE